jgi:hypothetical protein
VLPDNCLFADQAGEVFKILTEDCNLHTVLRLPRGTFTPYSPGVKANVVFFTKGYPTETVWVYDARTNILGITKKDRPLVTQHFADFERCYGNDSNGKAKRNALDSKQDRWRSFQINEVIGRNFKLNGFKWLKEVTPEDADGLPDPEDLVAEVKEELEEAVTGLGRVLTLFGHSNGENDGDGQRQRMTDDIPEGWFALQLADIVEPDALIQYGILQPGPDTPDGVPYVRPTEIRDGSIDVASLRRTTRKIADSYRRSSLKPGDVVLSIVGSIGKVAIVPSLLEGANITQSSARLRPRQGLVSSEFLAWFLRSPLAKSQFDEVELGTGVPRLNIGDIRRFLMPVAPAAEQRRIVATVERLFAHVDGARARLDKVTAILLDRRVGAATGHADMLTQAILGKAFRGKLVPTEAELARTQGRDYESASALLERLCRDTRAASAPVRRSRSHAKKRRSRTHPSGRQTK